MKVICNCNEILIGERECDYLIIRGSEPYFRYTIYEADTVTVTALIDSEESKMLKINIVNNLNSSCLFLDFNKFNIDYKYND